MVTGKINPLLFQRTNKNLSNVDRFVLKLRTGKGSRLMDIDLYSNYFCK